MRDGARRSEAGAGRLDVQNHSRRGGRRFAAEAELEGTTIVGACMELVDEDANELGKHRVALDSVGDSLGISRLHQSINERAKEY